MYTYTYVSIDRGDRDRLEKRREEMDSNEHVNVDLPCEENRRWVVEGGQEDGTRSRLHANAARLAVNVSTR